MEVYFINNINQLKSAQAITKENDLFTRRNLPQTKLYNWRNEDDHRVIEGILHYPPNMFESKNLSLLVLIHGGPYLASLNRLELVWYNWASLAASEDILCAVDRLIKDGIVDPHRLAVGGYSYGGFLTNWLITQTRRFNAAMSGAGVVDYASAWGMMDIPILLSYLAGGFPWEAPNIYQNEAPIYQLDRIHTPTHIITGENDNRVPTSQSYILERGLHYLGIPVKLISFPKEGHSMPGNPWYGKVKVPEELKWLLKYGNQSLNNNELSSNSERPKFAYTLQ
ncbi:unnamed protein product, partial [Rotaria sp. Silwood2]